MVQNSPIWIFVEFSHRDKTLPFHKSGQITHGTKLSRLEFYQISHRDKTLPYGLIGQITHGTKLSHMDFCRFSHRDKTLPFHKSGQITHGTKLSRMDFCWISHRDKTLPFRILPNFTQVQNSPARAKWPNYTWYKTLPFRISHSDNTLP